MIRPVLLGLLLIQLISAGCYAEVPRRIVSLAPSVTETLFLLGLSERIVGVTSFCDRPQEALKKPKVGGMTNPSLERIIQLNPDLVILTPEGNPRELYERLHSLGLRTYVFDAKSILELPEEIHRLGETLGVEDRARVLAERIEIYLKGLNRKPSGHPKKAVFIIWPEPLIVAGPGTPIDEALRLLGWQNVASDAIGRYPKYSVEELLRRSPDVILIGKGHQIEKAAEGLLRRLQTLEAVKRGRIYYLSDKLYRLSPSIIEGIEELRRYLRGVEE